MDQSSSLQLPLPTHEGLMKSGKGSDSDPEVSPESLVYLRMSVVFTVVLCLLKVSYFRINDRTDLRRLQVFII